MIVLAAALLVPFGLSFGFPTGSDGDWQLVVRMLAGLALLAAVLLGIGAITADELGRRLPPKRSLGLGAAAALGIGVVLTALLLVVGTIDALQADDFS